MTDMERYLFDINGFMVLRNVLLQDEVERLIEAIPRDEKGEIIHPPDDIAFEGVLGYDEPLYRNLIDHPRVLPYLDYLLAEKRGGPYGPKWSGRFYLGHEYGLVYPPGDEGFGFHNGATPYNGWLHYHTQDNQIYCGLTCVVWCLTDSEAGQGGFGCLPGSHKAYFSMPEEVAGKRFVPQDAYQPVVKAGDVIIFTEALVHGPLPWKGETHRLALFYKYVPGYMPLFEERDKDLLDLMTEEQVKYLKF